MDRKPFFAELRKSMGSFSTLQVSVNACTNTDVALLYNEGAGAASDVFTHATATGRWF